MTAIGSAALRRPAWCAALLLGMATAAFAGAAPGGRDGVPSGSSEISFPAPVRYAVVIRRSDNAQLLVTRGDSVVHANNPSRAVRIEEVQPDTLLVLTPAGVSPVRIGGRIPGPAGFVFARTASIGRLQYRYRTVEQITRTEPVLVALNGASATLDVEVPRRVATAPTPAVPSTPAPAAVTAVPVATAHAGGTSRPPAPSGRSRLDEDLLKNVEVRDLANGQYEVNKSDFRAVMDNAGRVLAELRPFVLPSLSARGFEYKVTSAASDGVLTPRGFTVWDAKMATRAGIAMGDTIVNVNGRAVDGLASLYKIYQELRENPAVARIEVELERAGERVKKVYQMR